MNSPHTPDPTSAPSLPTQSSSAPPSTEPTSSVATTRLHEDYRHFQSRALICWLLCLIVMGVQVGMGAEPNQVAGILRAGMFVFCLWFGITEPVYKWIMTLRWKYVFMAILAIYFVFAFKTQVAILAGMVAITFLIDRLFFERPNAR